MGYKWTDVASHAKTARRSATISSLQAAHRCRVEMQYVTNAMRTAAELAALKPTAYLPQACCGLQQLIAAMVQTTSQSLKVAASVVGANPACT